MLHSFIHSRLFCLRFRQACTETQKEDEGISETTEVSSFSDLGWKSPFDFLRKSLVPLL